MLPSVCASVMCLALIGQGEALDCYACRQEANFHNIEIPERIGRELRDFPYCKNFNPRNPAYLQACSAGSNGCIHIVDKSDAEDALRSCFPADVVGCAGLACYCNTSLCNRNWVWSTASATSQTTAAVITLLILLLAAA